MLSNERLSVTQSGNKKFHSTGTPLIHTTGANNLAVIDKRKVIAVVLLDRSMAFDSIDDDILLLKLPRRLYLSFGRHLV